jgi:hypothetical protein
MLLKQHLFHHIELAITRKVLKTRNEHQNRKNGRNTRIVENVVVVFWTNSLLQYDAFASLKNGIFSLV